MMAPPSNRPALTSIAPLFIVGDVSRSAAFYMDLLGFDVEFTAPDEDPFFAILARDGVRIMIKVIAPAVMPLQNHRRHAWARWDAFVHTPDPDALAVDFLARGLALHEPLMNTDDGLRGFEVKDVDGYVLFFGRPA